MVIDRVTEMLKTLPKDWSAGKYKVVFLLFLLCSCNDNLPWFFEEIWKWKNESCTYIHRFYYGMEIDKVIENWPYWEVRLKDYLKSNFNRYKICCFKMKCNETKIAIVFVLCSLHKILKLQIIPL